MFKPVFPAVTIFLVLAACQAISSRDSGIDLSTTSLVNLAHYDPSLLIDLQYKQSQNIAKRPLYHQDFPALLHRHTAKRIKKANLLLREHNLRLVIWDAYRPHETQLALWKASGKNETYVANPHRQPSLHSHGCAVDVSLAHLDGSPAVVPTEFDAFTHRAASDYPHPDPQVRANMQHLKEAMWAAGFGTLPHEWWHFMDKDYKRIPFISTETLPTSLQEKIRSTP
jgi:zinc D-Ala-D-Ala dipeptidase